jgi:hypothetical protein
MIGIEIMSLTSNITSYLLATPPQKIKIKNIIKSTTKSTFTTTPHVFQPTKTKSISTIR